MEKKVGKKVPKHLDDDEDRKNPAYIPRKGLFFEHDLRGQTQEEEVRYVSVPLGLWEGQASFQASLWQQGSLLQWDPLGRSMLLSPALCPARTLQLFNLKGRCKKTHKKSHVPGNSDPLSCLSQIAVGHQQLLGRRSRKEGCCLLCLPCPRNARALCVGLLETATSWPYSSFLLCASLFQAKRSSAEAVEGRGALGT